MTLLAATVSPVILSRRYKFTVVAVSPVALVLVRLRKFASANAVPCSVVVASVEACQSAQNAKIMPAFDDEISITVYDYSYLRLLEVWLVTA